jgi:GNAT superfamily N-acetyltransferase
MMEERRILDNRCSPTTDPAVHPTSSQRRRRRMLVALTAHHDRGRIAQHDHQQQQLQLQQKKTMMVPFLVEKLPRYPSPLIFPEIADMCIQAFFNDDTIHDNALPAAKPSSSSLSSPAAAAAANTRTTLLPPWKALQLNFLRRLQTADLERRRRREADRNVMLVARRIVPATTGRIDGFSTPLLLNLDGVVHRDLLRGMEDVVRGEILGFVEVTLKPYGLGQQQLYDDNTDSYDSSLSSPFGDDDDHNDDITTYYDDDDINGEGEEEVFTPWSWQGPNGRTPRGPAQRQQQPPPPPNSVIAIAAPVRPVLTNLSVRQSARGCGVGGALVAAAEETVRGRWHQYEIILEVEDDNHRALAFYQKRGYNVLFADKTARRYDVSGLWLQQKRCTRLVLRKALSSPTAPSWLSSSWWSSPPPRHRPHDNNNNTITKPISSVLQKLRDTYRSVVEAAAR